MANKLINEQSIYLLQHAHNPVDWYPWGDEPFERAKRENKPVLVSIGYAACHWCHVMEKESFEDDEVAAFMNTHFVNIKVDREEHPDVDHLYMDAVQGITGSGGWPLNVFVTPDRVPFYGGTYFPPRTAYNRISWMELLERMNDIWLNRPDDIKSQADQMLQYLKQVSAVGVTTHDNALHPDSCHAISENLLKQADQEYGGFGRAPKFPGTMAISYLLEYAHFTGNEAAKEHALRSLDAMIQGGIYDQLGGGLARYSTDAEWLVPHFEKMLYDNALLIIALCDAYSLTKAVRYKNAIERTIAFADREFKAGSGLYYSALDADSEGAEGKFYTWTWDEWTAALGEENPIVAAYFGVTEKGNWEHTNILHIAQSVKSIAEQYALPEQEVEDAIARVKAQLYAARAARIRPATDDKSLLSWNALMNLALAKAGKVLDNQAYTQSSIAHMECMLHSFRNGDDLMHVWKNGTARIEANLDDYAYLIQALLYLFSITGDEVYILNASELCEQVIVHFKQEDGVFFYYSSSRVQDIPVRKVDVYDGATPSANAVMANNLMLLGMCFGRNAWVDMSGKMVSGMADNAKRYPYSFAYWSILVLRFTAGMKTIVVSGMGKWDLVKALNSEFIPNGFIVTSKKEISEVPLFAEKNISKETLIFVCTAQECSAPVSSVKGTLQLISANLET